MSETEELQKKAKEQYVRERMSELEKYIDRLFSELEAAHRTRAKHGLMMMTVMSVWLISMLAMVTFGGTWLAITEQAANILFWMVMLVEWIIVLPRYFGLIDELKGCITTMEILGMIDKRDDGNKRIKKYRESWMAKMWEALKSKKMQKAFA